MPKELISRIPKKFYEMIEDERDVNYFTNIKEPLEKQKLKNETIIILGLIYRDFLCPPAEKKKLQEKDARELQAIQRKIEQEIREKNNTNDLFRKSNKAGDQTKNEVTQNALIVIQEEKWYKKIFSIIKKYLQNN